MQQIKVQIFEDNKHLRESLSVLINSADDLSCVGVYPSCNHILKNLTADNPDVILMDIEMPGINGIEAVKIVKKEMPNVQVLMQTIFQDDQNIFNAICAGASGYLLKSASSEQYIQAIRDVFHGGSPMSGTIARKMLTLFQKNLNVPEQANYQLTQKEKEVLASLADGKSFKMIGESLFISYETVRSHMKNIYAKLHVHSNTEAVIKAIREKLI